MNNVVIALSVASGISFIAYGVSCLVSSHMRDEFKRYGLARFRPLVGTLELLGGSAQLLAWWFPALGAFSSGGLAMLMALGVVTRVKIGDPLGPTLPAIAYMALNAYLMVAFIRI